METRGVVDSSGRMCCCFWSFESCYESGETATPNESVTDLRVGDAFCVLDVVETVIPGVVIIVAVAMGGQDTRGRTGGSVRVLWVGSEAMMVAISK